MVATIEENKIDFLIVDPFVSCHRVTENDNGAIDMVAKKFSDVASKTNASVGVEHHIRKTNGREATVEDGRGASSLVGAARAIEIVNKMTKEEAGKLGVHQHWRLRRRRHGQYGAAAGAGMVQVCICIAWERYFYPEGDNVGMVTTWTPPKPLDDVTPANFEAAVREIRKGKWKKSSRSNSWVGIAVARGMGLNLIDEKDKKRVKAVLAAWRLTRSERQRCSSG